MCLNVTDHEQIKWWLHAEKILFFFLSPFCFIFNSIQTSFLASFSFHFTILYFLRYSSRSVRFAWKYFSFLFFPKRNKTKWNDRTAYVYADNDNVSEIPIHTFILGSSQHVISQVQKQMNIIKYIRKKQRTKKKKEMCETWKKNREWAQNKE